MARKVVYEARRNDLTVAFMGPNGEIRVEPTKPFETSDEGEIEVIDGVTGPWAPDGHPDLKRVGGSKSGGDK